jgi:hypothetical protein
MKEPHLKPKWRYGNERAVDVPDYPKTHAGRAQAFGDGAREFLQSARALNASLSYRGQYVLTFHALELALKSFLAGAVYQMSNCAISTSTIWTSSTRKRANTA